MLFVSWRQIQLVISVVCSSNVRCIVSLNGAEFVDDSCAAYYPTLDGHTIHTQSGLNDDATSNHSSPVPVVEDVRPGEIAVTVASVGWFTVLNQRFLVKIHVVLCSQQLAWSSLSPQFEFGSLMTSRPCIRLISLLYVLNYLGNFGSFFFTLILCSVAERVPHLAFKS